MPLLPPCPRAHGLHLQIALICHLPFVTKTARHKLVRFAARVVSGRRKFDRVSDVIDTLGWLHIESLYKYRSMALVHKMLTTSEPQHVPGRLLWL